MFNNFEGKLALRCVSAVQRLQLSFEVCRLTRRADSTDWKAYHEPALMRWLISAVSLTTSEMLLANSITKETILQFSQEVIKRSSTVVQL